MIPVQACPTRRSLLAALRAPTSPLLNAIKYRKAGARCGARSLVDQLPKDCGGGRLPPFGRIGQFRPAAVPGPRPTTRKPNRRAVAAPGPLDNPRKKGAADFVRRSNGTAARAAGSFVRDPRRTL